MSKASDVYTMTKFYEKYPDQFELSGGDDEYLYFFHPITGETA